MHPFLHLLLTISSSLLEIKEGIDDATSRTKSGLMKAFKRIGTVKIEQEMILQLNEKMDRMFKRFSVGDFSVCSRVYPPDRLQETMSIIMSRQLSDLKAQLTEMRSEFQQQFLELKASAQVNCKDESSCIAQCLNPFRWDSRLFPLAFVWP